MMKTKYTLVITETRLQVSDCPIYGMFFWEEHMNGQKHLQFDADTYDSKRDRLKKLSQMRKRVRQHAKEFGMEVKEKLLKEKDLRPM